MYICAQRKTRQPVRTEHGVHRWKSGGKLGTGSHFDVYLTTPPPPTSTTTKKRALQRGDYAGERRPAAARVIGRAGVAEG